MYFLEEHDGKVGPSQRGAWLPLALAGSAGASSCHYEELRSQAAGLGQPSILCIRAEHQAL